MTRSLAAKTLFGSLLLALAACGAKTNPSICDVASLNTNPACSMTCDATPGVSTTCPAGFHCSADGMCDAQCDATHPCGDGFTCTADGNCMANNGSNDPGGPDANCPAVHFTAMPTTPSVQLLIDRSGSMDMNDISPTRYKAIQTGINTVVGMLDQQVYFGASLFSADSPCPKLYSTATRAKGNAAAIATLIASQQPGGNTPTAPSIDAVVADFAANPPPMGSPPVIILATDGEPNSCNDGTVNDPPSITAAQNAYTKGIRLFILGLAGLNTQFLQDMANAGTGVAAGQPNAPYYTANNTAGLEMAFQQIIGGVLSCDLAISSSGGGTVDPTTAMNGTVTLNGVVLMYGTDWDVDPNGMVVHLLGAACTTLKNSANPNVDAEFPCGSVIF